ncbi:tubulin-tyrosine ligase [Coprinopsis cinerea okayama7|uniref:Tubulin-tyrosine ligase n=1 Tax=Coprinopsis cinerea (strain Okayama-7 / 130 / ATCC MYA-4618 / FGSC 9003) TaxID=240176 RepID=A8N1W7_COPC7|nr:tubulin-tyrosine ligase [Coprinopsis cinerea okayama7\|eukprot:XP_001828866.1 tubulin-tyrosine ligase [Coprinopsis cinerea okayama7\
MASSSFSAVVVWPNAPLTDSLVKKALSQFHPKYLQFPEDDDAIVQWSSYDVIDHELLLTRPSHVLASSYIFRKALIRKHFLSRIVHAYCIKNPDTILKTAFPLTYELEISFADELDEMWTDELWELGERLDSDDTWWILKPGMANRGMGIRLFDSKDQLQQIFEDFEEEDDTDDDDTKGNDTSVVTSQLRHFIIQEYIPDPLLFDPREVSQEKNLEINCLQGHKFHLRVYCVATGALKLYLYDRILALFASLPYGPPTFEVIEPDEPPVINLQHHLTNTSLQAEKGEENVRLLDELDGCQILSGDGEHGKFTSADIKFLINQMGEVLSETFKAALENPIHFQAIPNAFELYGVDFLVSHSPNSPSPFSVKLLEINAEPAIELTGPRLTWILEDLFKSIAEVSIKPFFAPNKENDWPVGETRHHLLKCLDVSVMRFD